MKKRKIDLPFWDELVTLTKPDRASRPFTHPIKAENSCFLEWAGIKGRQFSLMDASIFFPTLFSGLP
jgi:hypothetical protein